MYLLDTNICIYALKAKYPRLTEKLLSVHPDQIKISAITVFELEYGAAKSKWRDKNREIMRMFLSSFDVLPFTEKDAAICGQIRAGFAARGTPIGAYDMMIAAQGISRNLVVVTHNVGEFQRVPGLSMEDWVAGMTCRGEEEHDAASE